MRLACPASPGCANRAAETRSGWDQSVEKSAITGSRALSYGLTPPPSATWPAMPPTSMPRSSACPSTTPCAKSPEPKPQRHTAPPRWRRSRAMPVGHFHRRNGFSCCLYRTFVAWKLVPGSTKVGRRAPDALEAIIRALWAIAAKPPSLLRCALANPKKPHILGGRIFQGTRAGGSLGRQPANSPLAWPIGFATACGLLALRLNPAERGPTRKRLSLCQK
jgi:hypothetical protein